MAVQTIYSFPFIAAYFTALEALKAAGSTDPAKAMGKTILLVEQNALKALAVADRAYVMEQGRITKTGTGKELLKDPAIAEAYLGKKKH